MSQDSLSQPENSRKLALTSIPALAQSLKQFLLIIGLSLLSATWALAAGSPAIAFATSFEETALYSSWSASSSFGSIALTHDVAYNGTQALKFQSTSGGNRAITLLRTLDSPGKGTVSIAFYDVAPGQETLYEQLSVYNSANTTVAAAVGTMDFDSQCYTAYVTTGTATLGPHANCGIYPQTTTSPVQRTAGWHILLIAVGASSTEIAIDGRTVLSVQGSGLFDTIRFEVSGPSYRPNTYAYIDDFSYTPFTY